MLHIRYTYLHSVKWEISTYICNKMKMLMKCVYVCNVQYITTCNYMYISETFAVCSFAQTHAKCSCQKPLLFMIFLYMKLVLKNKSQKSKREILDVYNVLDIFRISISVRVAVIVVDVAANITITVVYSYCRCYSRHFSITICIWISYKLYK